MGMGFFFFESRNAYFFFKGYGKFDNGVTAVQEFDNLNLLSMAETYLNDEILLKICLDWIGTQRNFFREGVS